MFESNQNQTKSNPKIMNKYLLSLASLLAVLNAKAIEIGPKGGGVELSGFSDMSFQTQKNVENRVLSPVETWISKRVPYPPRSISISTTAPPSGLL